MNLMDQSLGQLARQIPGATRVFEAHRVDFCCAGNRTLRTAAAAAGLDAEAVAAELQALQARGAQVDEPDLRQFSDEALVKLGCPHGLAEHLNTMAQELESHMRKEEMVLFPLIVRGQGARAGMPIGVMRAEHDEHGAALQRLYELTNDITLPRGACTTWHALYAGLKAFRDDLVTHIHIENNILFERFAPAAVH